jgi:hypothetical protein
MLRRSFLSGLCESSQLGLKFDASDSPSNGGSAFQTTLGAYVMGVVDLR